jgi:hypothetical protein
MKRQPHDRSGVAAMARHTRQESMERSLRPAGPDAIIRIAHRRLSYVRGEGIGSDRFIGSHSSGTPMCLALAAGRCRNASRLAAHSPFGCGGV